MSAKNEPTPTTRAVDPVFSDAKTLLVTLLCHPLLFFFFLFHPFLLIIINTPPPQPPA